MNQEYLKIKVKKNKLSIIFISLFFHFSQAQMTKWEENFLQEYDPQTYSYYKFGEGISSQGKNIANTLSERLNKFQNLIKLCLN